MTLTRYGAPCATCGVLRDYHPLTPRDHAWRSEDEVPGSCVHSAPEGMTADAWHRREAIRRRTGEGSGIAGAAFRGTVTVDDR